MLDMRRNDSDTSFRDQVAAFNFVGISERVEELEASSLPNREVWLSIMLGCAVGSVRSKLAFADSELAAASTVTQNIVQLRKASADVGPTLRRRGLLDLEAATQKLEGRVVEHFNMLLKEFELAVNSQDFVAIASQRNVFTGYCSEATGMEPVSGWRDAVRLYERDVSESDSTFQKPATLISAFVKIILTDARSDTAEIISTLDKMQAAIDAQHHYRRKYWGNWHCSTRRALRTFCAILDMSETCLVA